MMAIALVPDAGPPLVLRSFIAGMGERAALQDLAGLRIGAELRLRRAAKSHRGCSIEIMAAGGGPLGWLPREDEEVLEAVGADPAVTPVKVIGIVPAFQRPRIQIELVLPETSDTVVAPAA